MKIEFASHFKGVLSFFEFITAFRVAAVFILSGDEGTSFVLLLLEKLFVFCANFPLLNIVLTRFELQVIDLWANVGKLVEYRHYHEGDKARLSTGNIGRRSVTHD